MAWVDDGFGNLQYVDDVVKYGDEALEVASKAGKGAVEKAKSIGKGFASWLGGGSKTSATSKAKGAVKKTVGTIAKNKQTGKVRPIVLGGALAAGGYGGYKALSGGGSMPADYEAIGDWQTVLGQQPAGGMSPEEAAIERYIANATRAVSGAGGGGGGGGSGADMQRIYDILSGRATRSGAATIAAMDELARRSAQTAADIKAAGTTSAQDVQGRYNQAAATAAEGARMAGVEGSSLTPVSGEAAVAPENLRQTGASLSDFLLANNLIDAQTAGYLADFATRNRASYANDIARQNEMYIATDMARRAEQRRQQAAAAAAAQREALAQIALQGEKMRLDYALGQAARQPNLSLLNKAEIEKEWDTIKRSGMLGAYQNQGITNVNEFARYRLNQLQSAAEG